MLGQCIFCEIVAGRAPASVVHQDETFMAFMDIYPWRPGHVLVIPKVHAQYVHELAMDTRRELFALGSRIAEAVRASAIPCDDVHFLINDGPAANQTVGHVHLHVLPRRRGDLWRAALALCQRPFVTLMGQAPRATLDHQAEQIRHHLRE
ncbi:MAG: HIT family protein [Myxococcota bacterium]